MTDQHFHVPGCRCETHDAPFLNVRDERCVEWSKIQNASIAARVDAARAEERARTEAAHRQGDALAYEKLLLRAERDALAAAVERVRALADKWAEVLRECQEADPRWILDKGVTALETAHRELLAALDAPTPEQPAGEGEREVRDA